MKIIGQNAYWSRDINLQFGDLESLSRVTLRKSLSHWLPWTHNDAHQFDEGGKLNNERSAPLFLFCLTKSHICAYLTIKNAWALKICCI